MTFSQPYELGLARPRQTVQITNVGDQTATLPVFSFDGGGFAVVTSLNNCLGTVAASTGCTVTIEFDPPGPGVWNATFLATQLDGGGTGARDVTASAFHGQVPISIRALDGGASGVTAASPMMVTRRCPGECDFTVERTTTVTFTPDRLEASFVSWGGDGTCVGSSSPCVRSITSDAGAFVVANFTPWSVLTVSVPPAPAGDLRIVSDDGGIDCPSRCSQSIPPGGSVVLTGLASPFAVPLTWTGCQGTSGASCTVTESNLAPALTWRRFNRIFASEPLPMNLGGKVPYDQACNRFAVDAGLSLDGGGYIAWMSAGSLTAPSLGTASMWVRTDGLPALQNPPGVNAKPLYPVLVDHRGRSFFDGGPQYVATGINITVTNGADDCADWTDAGSTMVRGDATRAPNEWIDVSLNGWGNCTEPQRVYCFERNHVNGTNTFGLTVPDGGRYAFLTSSAVGSIANMDNVCNTTATSAGITGRSFVALRAQSDAGSALGRVNLDGGTWYRPDGVRFATPAMLLANTVDVPIGGSPVNDGGQLQFQNGVLFWSGSDRVNLGPTASRTCTDWTVNTSGSARAGQANTMASTWWWNGNTSTPQCTQTLAVHALCLER